MRKFLPVVLIAAIGLSGCGYVRDSRLNPFNWFGQSSSRPATPQEVESTNPLIPKRSTFARKPDQDLRQPIAGLENMTVERIPGGAIIRVTGVAAQTGAYDVELRPEGDGEPVDGVARYVMVAYQAPGGTAGPIQTRRVTAAARLSNIELTNVSSIEVISASNVLTSRR